MSLEPGWHGLSLSKQIILLCNREYTDVTRRNCIVTLVKSDNEIEDIQKSKAPLCKLKNEDLEQRLTKINSRVHTLNGSADLKVENVMTLMREGKEYIRVMFSAVFKNLEKKEKVIFLKVHGKNDVIFEE